MKIIGIDAATIIPGKGGAGGGIWIYTKNILIALDQLLEYEQEISIKVFANKTFDLEFKHIDIVRIDADTEKLLNRLKYVHIMLPRLCKKLHVDVLHKLATEVPFFYKGSMVVTIHDLIINFYLKKKYYGKNLFQLLKLNYFSYIEKIAVKKSDAVFTNSESLKDELIKLYGNKNVLVTGLGNPVNADALITRPKKKPICFYCIAGYYPHKGHARVIKLVECLVSKYGLDIMLYFRGNPSHDHFFNTIMEQIRQSPCRERIVIENYVQQHALTEIYANASVMILLSEYEGFGLPIIEAQALGVPVICSDISVFREVSGGYACFVGLDNMEKAASVVDDFLQNEEAQQFNITNGFTNTKRFQWGKIGQQLLQAYKSL